METTDSWVAQSGGRLRSGESQAILASSVSAIGPTKHDRNNLLPSNCRLLRRCGVAVEPFRSQLEGRIEWGKETFHPQEKQSISNGEFVGRKAEMLTRSIQVRVSGEFACFTRPEAKVERLSYSVITPSAARNLLDAICWRPQMRWIITRIQVLKPIPFMSVLRNEVQSTVSPVVVNTWIADCSRYKPLVAGTGHGTDGTPRNTTLLRDVTYVIEAYPHVFHTSGDHTPAKYLDMMQRRIDRGQCFQRPYLGCREFAADFGPIQQGETPIRESMELGRMLYDIVFLPSGNRPIFFEARLENGVMETMPERVLTDESRRMEMLQCSFKR